MIAARPRPGLFIDLFCLLPVRAAAAAVAHEMAVLWYALLAWRARPDVHAGELGFSIHRRSGYGGVLGAVGLAAGVEAVVVHLLVQRRSATAAWVLTALALYGLVWLLGHFQAVRLRPVLLTPEALHVRVGLLWSVRVSYRNVASFAPAGVGAPAAGSPGYLHAVPLGGACFLVELREPVEVQGPYGWRKRGVRRIGLAPDERERFAAELALRLGEAR